MSTSKWPELLLLLLLLLHSVRIASLAVLYAQLREQPGGGSGGGPGAKARGQSALGPDATAPPTTDADKDAAAALMLAVEQGDALRVEELLLAFSCTSLRQEASSELILSAAQLGHAAVIHTLAKYGANLEITDEVRGGRPLMHAATNGHAGAATALLKVRPPSPLCLLRFLFRLVSACL